MGILDLFRKWQDKQSGKHLARRRKQLVKTEMLEIRRVLTPVVVVSGSTVNVHAATTDPITVSNQASGLTITVDGSAHNFIPGTITAINVVGTSGSNKFTLSGDFSSITMTIKGNGGNDTLVGPDTVNQWDITAGNKGTLNDTISFQGIKNLQGGHFANTFSFQGGFIQGNIIGGATTNTLDYTTANTGLLVNLGTGAATAVGGTVQNITNVLGNGGAGNTLVGMNGANVWAISSGNTGEFVDTPKSVVPTTYTVTFSNFSNLTGGTGANTFELLQNGFVSGTLNGGTPASGTINQNWLDYSSRTNGVLVNLSTGSATGVGNVVNIMGVHAGNAASSLTGGTSNVLVGGSGNDILKAGTGRSILIGGLGADTITGGASQNIMIAGLTTYDENFAALSAIIAEWRLNESFTTRVNAITNGGGVNGNYKLVANSTVLNDKATNSITDGTGTPNWLWGGPNEFQNPTSSDVTQSPIIVSPVLTGVPQASFTVGGPPVAVASNLQITDQQSATLRSATVQIGADYNPAQDVLKFTSTSATGNILGSFNSTTGTLTLTSLNGTATVAQFQAALQSVTYSNSSLTPTTLPRTIAIQVYDGLSYSNQIVGYTNINFAPVLSGTSTASFTPGGDPVVINPNITVSDANTPTLLYATVTISHNFQEFEDVLAFTGAPGASDLTGTYNAATGVLTITSTAGAPRTLAQFQAALQAVTYQDTESSTPFLLPRTISFQVFDGAALSNIVQSTVTV